MGFKFKNNFGQHNIYEFDTKSHKFLEYFQKLFDYQDMGKVFNISKDFHNNKDLNDKESDLHKLFYNDIKTNENFKKLYCDLILDICNFFFPNESVWIYQSFPSIRIQFFNSIVVPPHYDSDEIGNHPLGEKNFILPITKMYGTNRLFIESEPNKKDFAGIDMEYGELLCFNGNKCTHYNMENIEQDVRISLDFRIILFRDYMNYLLQNKITFTKPRENIRNPVKMIVGGYYQLHFKDDIAMLSDNWINNKNIIQSRPFFGKEEAESVYHYMNEDNFITEYKKTKELEIELSKFIKTKHCIMVPSGTAALLLALLAINIKQGDEIIVPNYTMIATINVVKLIGAIPIIIDVDQETFTLNLNDIKPKINHKTKAIIHVSLNNRIKNLEEIVEYCKENKLELIEDAAQSLGCFYKNKHIGTFGKIGCFSLSTPKIISTGQGGFLVCNDDDIYSRLNALKNFGRAEDNNDLYLSFGLNFKFTDIQAIIGLEQLKKLPYRINRMKEIYNLYYHHLSKLDKYIKIHPIQFDGWIPWFVDILINDLELKPKLIDFLKTHNIQTRITYPEINKTNTYFSDEIFVNSNYISNHGLFLPSHILLTDNEIIYICKVIKLFFIC